jgi:hypothetical protein
LKPDVVLDDFRQLANRLNVVVVREHAETYG